MKSGGVDEIQTLENQRNALRNEVSALKEQIGKKKQNSLGVSDQEAKLRAFEKSIGEEYRELFKQKLVLQEELEELKARREKFDQFLEESQQESKAFRDLEVIRTKWQTASETERAPLMEKMTNEQNHLEKRIEELNARIQDNKKNIQDLEQKMKGLNDRIAKLYEEEKGLYDKGFFDRRLKTERDLEEEKSNKSKAGDAFFTTQRASIALQRTAEEILKSDALLLEECKQQRDQFLKTKDEKNALVNKLEANAPQPTSDEIRQVIAELKEEIDKENTFRLLEEQEKSLEDELVALKEIKNSLVDVASAMSNKTPKGSSEVGTKQDEVEKLKEDKTNRKIRQDEELENLATSYSRLALILIFFCLLFAGLYLFRSDVKKFAEKNELDKVAEHFAERFGVFSKNFVHSSKEFFQISREFLNRKLQVSVASLQEYLKTT